MDGPGHHLGGWPGAQTTTCASCGSSIPPPADRCPRCGRLRVDDNALTVLGDTPLPTPTPAGSSEDVTRFAAPSSGVKSYVGAEDSADDVTRIVAPGDAAADVTRVVIPADAFEDVTRFVDAGEAQTIAAPSDSLPDAMTVAAPATPTPHGARRAKPTNNAGPLEVGQSFGPRYHIIRLLGAGGMGAVYQAWDAELGVAVAIKVIRPEVMEDPATAEEVGRRFKRELLLARQVTHKNVVRIHDIGDIDGIKYITMSYVEGTDLASILKKDGKRPIAELLGIARSVISGLVAAHTAGVVHRDLKPANIMISKEGEALIMDFGIAHSTGDPAAAVDPGAGVVPEHLKRNASLEAATTLGSIIGTVEYMAPEQAKGQPIDQRVDVYAFGLILYDALLGQRRISSGAAAVEELQRRMAAPPPPLQALSSDIPGPLAALVARCVEPDADKRFQTSADVAAELDRLDDEGKIIPVARRLTKRMVAVAVVIVAGLLTATFYVTRSAVQPAQEHADVTVVIADFHNATGDPSFNRTLEPIMKLALEGASFISAYDRSAIGRLGVTQLPQQLDETAARTLAVQQGVGVVVSGSVERRGNGYSVAVKALRPGSGEVLATEDRRASTKEQVLAAVTNLASELRSAFGDEDSAKYAGMETLTVTSLDAVGHYVAGMDSQLNQRYDEAIGRFTMAVKADPDFGYAYAAMSTAARNLSRQADAEQYAKAAMSKVGRMTEREKIRSRGLYFMTTGDYATCTKEFADLVARFPADDAANNNLAVCSTRLRGLARSLEARRRAVAILPNRPVYRSNMAFDATYSGDFKTGEQEARKAQELGSPISGSVALAFAQLAQGRVSDAIATYQQAKTTDSLAASRVSAGLGELALYEGRLKEAAEILQRGSAADVTAKLTDRAAQKLVSVAHIQLMRQQRRAALAAVDAAGRQSQSIKVRFLSARVLVEAGQIPAAQKLAASLASELEAEPRALAKVIEGEIALKNQNARMAIKPLSEANEILDTWIGRFTLGRAYLEAGLPAQAEGEFDRCYERRGESLSLFVDDQPTFGYLPLLYYYRGRVFQDLGSPDFAEQYRMYLNIREKAGEDPLLPEVRKRASGG